MGERDIETAESFAEDVAHIRRLLVDLKVERGDIRRLSAILRRYLVEGTLGKIARPRIGKFKLRAPNNDPIYSAITADNTDVFISGGAHLFGFAFRAMCSAHPSVVFKNFDPDKDIELKLDRFLTQKVIFWRGVWISRNDVIKYIANVAEGVHSGSIRSETEHHLSAVRNKWVVGRRDDGSTGLAYRPDDVLWNQGKLAFSANAIDCVLVELFAAARFFVDSPSIIELQKAIEEGG